VESLYKLLAATWPELSIRTSEEWWRGVYQAAPIRKEIDAEGVDIPLPWLGNADDGRRVPAEDRLAADADADYGDCVDIPREQVANTLETARRFVAAMETVVHGHAR